MSVTTITTWTCDVKGCKTKVDATHIPPHWWDIHHHTAGATEDYIICPKHAIKFEPLPEKKP